MTNLLWTQGLGACASLHSKRAACYFGSFKSSPRGTAIYTSQNSMLTRSDDSARPGRIRISQREKRTKLSGHFFGLYRSVAGFRRIGQLL